MPEARRAIETELSGESILIIGAGPASLVGGELSSGLANVRVLRGRKELDVLDKEAVLRAVENFPGRLVVNASGNVEVSKAETSPDLTTVNYVGVENLIEACGRYGKTLVHFSSETIRPYYETGPLLESYFPMKPPEGAYAQSKWRAENAVRKSGIDHVILRIAYPSGKSKGFLERLRAFNKVFSDQLVTPTWVPDLVGVVDDIRKKKDLIGETLNVASPTAVTPLELRQMLDAAFGVETAYLISSLKSEIANHQIKPARPLDARLSVIESQLILDRDFTSAKEQVKLFAAAATS